MYDVSHKVISQNLKQVEILDYMKPDFGDYNLSLQTLARLFN